MAFPMLSTSMLRILRWLDDHPASLESAWDVPRSISLEGIADGIGVVRSALFQPMSVLEEEGLIMTRQAHVIGAGRRKRKVVHITEQGRQAVHETDEDVAPRPSRQSSNLKGQIPEYTILHGRTDELKQLHEAIDRGVPIHLRGMPGIGKSTLARSLIQSLAEEGIQVHWGQLDAYCDVHEAMQRMEIDAPQILDVDGYASVLNGQNVFLVFDDVHAISSRHQTAFSNVFKSLHDQGVPILLIGRDRDTLSIEGAYLELGPLDANAAIELLNPELGEERSSIVETLGGHPLAILLYDDATPLPETDQDVRAYVEQVVLGEATSDVHEAMSPFLVLPFPIPSERMPNPDDVSLLDEHTLLRWASRDTSMEMQHLIRNVCKSSLDVQELDELHLQAIQHWQQDDDALAAILEMHHRIQRGEEEVSDHLSSRANELMHAYSGAFATLLDEALANESENLALIELAAQHALNRAEIDVAKHYLEDVDSTQLTSIRLQIAQFEGKKGVMDELESMLNSIDASDEKLRIQMSVLSRSIDDLSSSSSEDAFERIDRLLGQIELPDDETNRQIVLTTLVVMQHALAIERGDFKGATFLIEQLREIASSSDPLIQYLEVKSELKSIDSNSPSSSLVLKNAEHTASQMSQPLYKASIYLLICEGLVDTQRPRAQLLHDQIDVQTIESMETPSARRLLAKWWEVKSMFDVQDRVFALREAILRYRAVGCPNRARNLSKRMHQF